MIDLKIMVVIPRDDNAARAVDHVARALILGKDWACLSRYDGPNFVTMEYSKAIKERGK